MLFFCTWENATSLLIDDVDRAAAIEVATEQAGLPPDKVVGPLPPRAFVCEVYVADDDDEFGAEEGDLVVDPLDHVAEMLGILDGGGGVETPTVEVAAAVEVETCGNEAEDEFGTVATCELAKGHDAPHRAGGLFW